MQAPPRSAGPCFRQIRNSKVCCYAFPEQGLSISARVLTTATTSYAPRRGITDSNFGDVNTVWPETTCPLCSRKTQYVTVYYCRCSLIMHVLQASSVLFIWCLFPLCPLCPIRSARLANMSIAPAGVPVARCRHWTATRCQSHVGFSPLLCVAIHCFPFVLATMQSASSEGRQTASIRFSVRDTASVLDVTTFTCACFYRKMVPVV